MKIVWTREAERDRLAIWWIGCDICTCPRRYGMQMSGTDHWDHLVARDPAAAIHVDQLFSDAVARLADFPLLGHVGDIAGTRELTPHRNYRLVYEVVGDTLWILVLIHSARQCPPYTTDGYG